MARLSERDYTYFTTVRGACGGCGRVVPARVVFRAGRVWQEPLCPDCEPSAAAVAGDVDWYLGRCLGPFNDRSPLEGSRASSRGCPLDCGPCAWHATPCLHPAIPVTGRSDLEWRAGTSFDAGLPGGDASAAEVAAALDEIMKRSGPVDEVLITGGEPMLHPDILGVVEACAREDVGRVAVSTSGLALAGQGGASGRLAELGAHVRLALDTLDPGTSLVLHGRDVVDLQAAALDALERAGVAATVVCRLVRGVNEGEIAAFLDLLRAREPVTELVFETGPWGPGSDKGCAPRAIPVDEAARLVANASRGELAFEDFVFGPAAHPLCRSACPALAVDGRLVPLARSVPREAIAASMSRSHLMRIEREHEFFSDAVNSAHARGDGAEGRVFKRLFEGLYPTGRAPGLFERQRIVESAVKLVRVHALMGAGTLDCTRAMLCPDVVWAGRGRLVPRCFFGMPLAKEAGADAHV